MSESLEATPANPRRRMIDWRKSGRWFAAEFLVVVTGVLVALAASAWWTARQEAIHEAQVLGRLHEESEAVVGYFRGDLTP